jgi:GNAT superfamily N-acetyltransferase
MDDIKIRECDEKDDVVIAGFLRRMLEEMADAGGHPVNLSDAFWQVLPLEVRGPHRKCFVAEHGSGVKGFILANIQPLDDVFEPMQSLHISAIYVCPEYRRKGIAKQLVTNILQWGRTEGCQQADLNVLPGNAARHFYERLGFRVFQHSMTKEME